MPIIHVTLVDGRPPEQVERFAATHAAQAIDPLALAEAPEKTVATLLAWAGEKLKKSPALIYASAPPDKVAADLAKWVK